MLELQREPYDQPELPGFETEEVDLFDAIIGHVSHFHCGCGSPELPDTVIHTDGALGDNVVFTCVCGGIERHAELTLIDLEVTRRNAPE